MFNIAMCAILCPFLVTAWMYATPIAYSATLVPERWRALYGLNPMVGVVEGFRWMLLDKPFPDTAHVHCVNRRPCFVLFFRRPDLFQTHGKLFRGCDLR